MHTSNSQLVQLEKQFWQALVDEDTEAAIALLAEPSTLISSHGVMSFDHNSFRQMAEKAPELIKSFQLSDVNVVQPNEDTAVITYRVKQTLAKRGQADAVTQEMADSSVWARQGEDWRCVMHTETPLYSH
ncbi:nuclear transport factor 2 family protein [Chitinolyticbacter meiyuanensis]|uniref:nuclear transport factor 2 family protein n=1 Tax=Chitinolyticbacter meiyuanensis TaxID=682798 RepID=UPI0011E5E4A8|nr:nuclear transport factor 2 family protein [Chitinolyticbacter meiyuanensis]